MYCKNRILIKQYLASCGIVYSKSEFKNVTDFDEIY
jgi:hypothetical protein